MKPAILIAFLLLAPAALAQDIAGRFDYYVLSLSWSPSWCRAERDAEQCASGRKLGFVVHGLWPQYERGWPEYCRTEARDPPRRETRAMADVMGTGGLAWHQWKKHGRCSGLPARDYFALTREAAARIALPETLRRLDRDVTLPAQVIEDAFIEANPGLARDGITVTCRARALQEIRICLTRDLQPRACAEDARRDCLGSFLMPAPR
ncbi:ribonuclease T [Paracoccus versutus]|uniref:Ribonuclease T2 n=1 Tax=Paracoccus versutus TaxID=34007 RepID=A0AAQ0HJ74_PARVE|nr:ribonuclease T2 [Paracoccus versutus]WGR60226.1 ribonuclease T [Paracoccus ferrooxidans]SFX56864.1 ribonuclease T2 [Paracoccus pantotrophus]KGJ11353.1 ribonuclease T [Paracoccus versutus]REG53197.1 ribonuclease T2 [Paracoccus versutus]WEJ78893.1 ribonuclease T [Paracoccus versutus]